MVFKYALQFAFSTSNTEAEYEALITDLKLARELGAQELKVISNSQLVVRHVNEEFDR